MYLSLILIHVRSKCVYGSRKRSIAKLSRISPYQKFAGDTPFGQRLSALIRVRGENSFIEIDWPGRLKGDDNQENANRVNLFVESGAGTICIRHKMVSVPVKSPNSKARKQIKIFT